MSGTAQEAPTVLPMALGASGLETATRLAPDDPFPDVLGELSLEQLQILHSRLCRQLEVEYLTAPDGRHPMTLDRLNELQVEFDTRFLR